VQVPLLRCTSTRVSIECVFEECKCADDLSCSFRPGSVSGSLVSRDTIEHTDNDHRCSIASGVSVLSEAQSNEPASDFFA
jgi:hypothetical protein